MEEHIFDWKIVKNLNVVERGFSQEVIPDFFVRHESLYEKQLLYWVTKRTKDVLKCFSYVDISNVQVKKPL